MEDAPTNSAQLLQLAVTMPRIVYFEGVFCSPGQPLRKIALVQENEEMKVVWNDSAANGNAHGMHDFLPLIDDNGSSALLVFAFHSSGSNTRNLAAKCFSSQGFGLWCDSNRQEMIVFPNQQVLHPKSSIASVSFQTDDAMVLGLIREHPGAMQEMKMILKWFHPGKRVAYVILRRDLKVQFLGVLDNFNDSVPHGWWAWSEENQLLTTHFHFQGRLNESGMPIAPFTCLQKIDAGESMNSTTYFRAIGGDGIVDSSPDQVAMCDGNEKHLKNFHIVAHSVWRHYSE